MSKVKNLFRNIWNVLVNFWNVLVNFIELCVLTLFAVGRHIWLILKVVYWLYILRLPKRECVWRFAKHCTKLRNRYGGSIIEEETEEFLRMVYKYSKHH